MTATLDNALDALTSLVEWGSTSQGGEILSTWNAVVKHMWGSSSPAEDPLRLLRSCLASGSIHGVSNPVGEAVRDISHAIEYQVVPGVADLEVEEKPGPGAFEATSWAWHAQPLDLALGSPYPFHVDGDGMYDPQNRALRAVLTHSSDLIVGEEVVRRTVLWPWVDREAWGTDTDVFDFGHASPLGALVPGVPDVIVGQWYHDSPPEFGNPDEYRGDFKDVWETAEAGLLRYMLGLTAVARHPGLSRSVRFSRSSVRRAGQASRALINPCGRVTELVSLGGVSISGGRLVTAGISPGVGPGRMVWEPGF